MNDSSAPSRASGKITRLAAGLGILLIAGALGFWADRFFLTKPQSQPPVVADGSTRVTAVEREFRRKQGQLTADSLVALQDEEDRLTSQVRIWEQVRNLTAAEAGALARNLLANGKGDYNFKAASVYQVVVARWAELAPREAAEFVPSAEEGQFLFNGVFAVMPRLVPNDLPAAEKMIKALPTHSRGNAWQHFYGAWARTDPAAAAADYATRGLTDEDTLAAVIAGRWAQTDPKAALAWSRTLQNEKIRAEALTATLSGALRTDPASGRAFLEQESDPAQRRVLAGALATAWMAKDAPGARAWIESLTDPAEKAEAVVAAAARLVSTSPTEALAFLSKLPESAERKQKLDAFLEKTLFPSGPRVIASGASKAILAMLKEQPELASPEFLNKHADALARDDPKAAMEVAQKLPDRPVGEKLQEAAFKNWVMREPAEASQVIENLSDAEQRTKLSAQLVESWGSRDFPAALAWARARPEGESEDALEKLITRHSHRNPVQSAAALTEWLATAPAVADDPRYQGVHEAISSGWAERDPTAAAAWATQLPPGENRRRAVSTIARQWQQQSEPQAKAWIDSLPAADRPKPAK